MSDLEQREDRIWWSIDSLPSPRPPRLVEDLPDEPVDAAIAFLRQDGNAIRYLARHPGCGPEGCRRCATARERCGACRWATYALEIVDDAPLPPPPEPKPKPPCKTTKSRRKKP